jgi:3-methylfumaryl-CoA hydratase
MVAETWQEWVGRRETATGQAGEFQARGLAALLDGADAPRDGNALPVLGYWFLHLPTVPMSAIGPDGHPRRGGFLPPIPLDRRMWAGSRIQCLSDIRVGDKIEKTSTILKVAEKHGKTGPMVFVTVGHRLEGPRGPVAEEEQDIVFLAMPEKFEPPPGQPLPASLEWTQAQAIDPVMLFRFSALTFNAHRIHYDIRYAQEAEKYPGLVVHGPLQALLLFDAALKRYPGRKIASYAFRSLRPLFDFDRITLSGRATESGLELFTANGDGHIGMQATLAWRSP